MNPSFAKATEGARGFSLIGMVLTIGIIGAILITVETILTSSSLVKTTQFDAVALGLAQGELERLRAGGYDALPASGAVADANLALLPQGAESVTVTDYDTKIKRVDVAVSWVEPRGGATSISLTTLVAKVGGLP